MIKVNMNGKELHDQFEKLILGIPDIFRKRLAKEYFEIKNLYKQGKYEFSGLKTGKFCEATLRFLQQHLTGTFIPFGDKIPNFIEECEKLLKTQKNTGNESLRILIPHALKFLYSIRSKRGVGHIGGDIDSNEMDGMACISLIDWIISELVRIFHGVTIEQATALIQKIITRHLPIIWEIEGKKRVLNTSLSYKEKVLVLLYSTSENKISAKDLFEWVEYSRLNLFKTNILKPLHEEKLIEYDEQKQIIFLSPLGCKEVESKILIDSIQ